MKTARSNAVIMPNSEQGEHTSRKGAMNRQMRPDNTMPILNGTTGSDSLIPGSQKVRGACSPSRVKALQQVLAGRTKHSSTQPCPGHQSHRLRPQDVRGLLLHRIEAPSKQQGLGQSQADLFREHLNVPLQGRSGGWDQFVQQVQQSFNLAVPLGTAEQAIGGGHHDLQQGMQLLAEIANPIGHVADLSQQSLLLRKLSLGMSSSCLLSVCLAFRLPLDGWQTVLFGFHRTIKPPLNLCGDMEEMPDISLVMLFPRNLTHGFLDGPTSVAYCAHTADALLAQIPQHQDPTFAIDLHRWDARPDLPTVDINHIQIRFSPLAAVLFIQAQSTRGQCLLLGHPTHGSLPCFFDNADDLSHTDVDPMHASQTGLNASITGVRFDQHGQHQAGNRSAWLHGQDRLSQRLFQCLASGCRPTVQRLTRYLMGTAQLTDQPVGGLSQDLTDHVNALLNSATMDHGSSLRTVMLLTVSPYLSGILFVHFFVICHIGSSSF